MSTTEPSSTPTESTDRSQHLDFVRQIVADEQAAGRNDGRVATRFPPEPNGYLHLGHAKAICLSYGISRENKGTFNLRFDDTNPAKEDTEYVESIKEDVRWLGADWGERLYFTSDYYEKLYAFATELMEKGLAYVDSSTPEEIREGRGSLTEPGTASKNRDRPVEENLDLFKRMRAGEFKDHELVVRAKVDMASPNLNMRDPLIYRIMHVKHHRTGDAWCIYPLYDFAHGLSDAIEEITHSLCTLEFENHRPLYDWFLENITVPSRPRQIEFAPLHLTYTVLSKRKLRQLVEEKVVSGWDDPRMPTLSGMRRRGVTAQAIWDFCHTIGITKFEGHTDVALLENALRHDLNIHAIRRMAVLNPIKVVVENYPEGEVEYVDAINNHEDESAGTRKVPFTRELYIERDDFMEDPPRKFFRLGPGREVRFRYAYYLTCTEVIKDDKGEITEIRCTYDPDSRGGNTEDGRRVKGTIHWVSATECVDAEVHLYDRLFTVEDPLKEDGEFTEYLNPNSLTVLPNAKCEPALQEVEMGKSIQFERLGYFCADKGSSKESLVFNRTVALRDSWAKKAKK